MVSGIEAAPHRPHERGREKKMKYDYEENVAKAVESWIKSHGGLEGVKTSMDKGYGDDIEWYLTDELWDSNEVTGNGDEGPLYDWATSGKCLSENWELIADAIDDNMLSTEQLSCGPETVDTCLRCYVLKRAIHKALANLGEFDID